MNSDIYLPSHLKKLLRTQKTIISSFPMPLSLQVFSFLMHKVHYCDLSTFFSLTFQICCFHKKACFCCWWWCCFNLSSTLEQWNYLLLLGILGNTHLIGIFPIQHISFSFVFVFICPKKWSSVVILPNIFMILLVDHLG